jgi:hypothetical protein
MLMQRHTSGDRSAECAIGVKTRKSVEWVGERVGMGSVNSEGPLRMGGETPLGDV